MEGNPPSGDQGENVKRMNSILGPVSEDISNIYWRWRQKYLLPFAFVHINKTGGSSIESALGIRFQHKNVKEMIEQIGVDRWKKKFTFTVVRNPWDKVVSHYFNRVRTNQTNMRDKQIEFPIWVKKTYGDMDPEYYDKPKMFMPQIDWLTDSSDQVAIDFIARFENLENDFQHVCQKIGRSSRLPHLKKSERKEYSNYYDEESKQIVSNWFREDIKKFGYSYAG